MRAALETAQRRSQEAAARLAQIAPLERKLQAANDWAQRLQVEMATRDGRIEAEREAQEKLRQEIEERFNHLATAALKSNEQSFLNLATQVFEKHKSLDDRIADKRQQALFRLVEPITRTLVETKQKLEQIEKERDDSFGQIKSQLASVGREAARLTHALKSSPGTRGRWGEESLRNALELAGLSPHCDFDTQKTFRG